MTGNVAAKEWLSIRDVVGYAAVSDRTLRTWIHSPVNPLPAVRVAGKLLVRRADLDRWLEQHRLRTPALDLNAIVRDTLRRSSHGR